MSTGFAAVAVAVVAIDFVTAAATAADVVSVIVLSNFLLFLALK
jgi:hypothetical protein